jgi:ketosteroid isomerase-like protein
MRSSILATFALALFCSPIDAVELTEEQTAPWNALEKQVALGMDRKWDSMEEFLHAKLSIWGDNLPTPVSFSAKAYAYFTKLEDEGDEVIAHHLVPVSVTVVGDVAIINAYHHVATKDDGDTKETIYRLHNTWKKDGGKWKLLATFNTVVPSAEEDVD